MSAIDSSMLDLFRQEVESATPMLTSGLLELEKGNSGPEISESLMRTSHSVKGAARMVGVDPVVKIAHIMEDCFVSLQQGEISFSADDIDVLLSSVDVITMLSEQDNIAHENSYSDFSDQIESTISKLNDIYQSRGSDKKSSEKPPASNNSMQDLFIADSTNLLEKLSGTLGSINSSMLDKDSRDEFVRVITSLKSGSMLSGIKVVSAICDNILQTLNLNEGLAVKPSLEIISQLSECISNTDQDPATSKRIQNTIGKLLGTDNDAQPDPDPGTPTADKPSSNSNVAQLETSKSIKVSSSRLDRLVALAGESMVESQWVRGYANDMVVYKRRQTELVSAIDMLRNYIDDTVENDYLRSMISDIQSKANLSRGFLSENLGELEEFDRRATGLAERLNQEVLSTRMRPFSDCTQGFERMVRDLGRTLDKKVSIEIIGENTQVDRDILERIDAPLNHIIRNAIDHGLESPGERVNQGKNETGKITVEASHNMGMLSIIVTDDGRGIDTGTLKQSIISKKLVSEAMASTLSESELLEFLYLPSFTTRDNVTEISGRGVGLDVVHSAIQEMRGQIRTTNTHGKGLRIQLLLPLTLSIVRSLLVDIGGQHYAFPLARIGHIFTLQRDQIKVVEDKQYFSRDGQNISLVDATQILEVNRSANASDTYPVIMIGDRNNYYGIVVNAFLGERDLSVHLVDPRLGKIRDISAAALTEDGTPVMIVDVDDMLRSIDILISGERLNKVKRTIDEIRQASGKRVLVVDDSITVREVERKLLEAKGYEVDIAVDGMDGWNTVRSHKYDLIISDIDMPRMNGIEFVTMIKQDPGLKHIPVMIVSYKDREEDRDAGLQAGADYYLTKGSFHDESLIDAVVDLIGEA